MGPLYTKAGSFYFESYGVIVLNKMREGKTQGMEPGTVIANLSQQFADSHASRAASTESQQTREEERELLPF